MEWIVIGKSQTIVSIGTFSGALQSIMVLEGNFNSGLELVTNSKWSLHFKVTVIDNYNVTKLLIVIKIILLVKRKNQLPAKNFIIT